MDAVDFKFRTALNDYRREKTVQIFSRAHLYNLGPGAIMGDDILKRIVDCARAQKLDSLDALKKETKWSRADELGNGVLELVSRCV